MNLDFNRLTLEAQEVHLLGLQVELSVSAYEFYKGPINDFSALSNKGFNSLDSYILYVITKAYLGKQFD